MWLKLCGIQLFLELWTPPNNIPIAKSIYVNAKLNVDFPSISFERPSYALKVILMDL